MVGAGFPDTARSQARPAREFFESVTGKSIFDPSAGDNVIVTGHSLGDGLAGYIGALSGTLCHALSYLVLPFSPRDIR